LFPEPRSQRKSHIYGPPDGRPAMDRRKILLLIFDGLGDRPIPELARQTPLQTARKEHLDWFAANGVNGLMDPIAHLALAAGAFLLIHVVPSSPLRAALVARGHAHHDPIFSLFFLSADFLPAVRLSPRGVWDVKRKRVLLPARRRASRA